MTAAVPPPPVTRSRWLIAAAIVGVAAFAIMLVLRSGHPTGAADDDAPGTMMAVAPGGVVDLASLPEEHQALYRAAAADHGAFAAVACYCGCEAFLDHRHLLDCFERPAGGWERHATGCAVCLAEARDVIEMRDGAMPLDRIVRQIDTRFGAFLDPAAA